MPVDLGDVFGLALAVVETQELLVHLRDLFLSAPLMHRKCLPRFIPKPIANIHHRLFGGLEYLVDFPIARLEVG